MRRTRQPLFCQTPTCRLSRGHEEPCTSAGPDLPPGTPVLVRLDDGTDWETVTRSEPWELGHGGFVVLLKGRSGGFALERVRLGSGPAWEAAESERRTPTMGVQR